MGHSVSPRSSLSTESPVGLTDLSGDIDATLQRLCTEAHRLFQTDIAVMFGLNPVNGTFWSRLAVAGELKDPAHTKLTMPRPDGITHRVIEQGHLVIGDLSQAPAYQNRFTQNESVLSFYGLALHDERGRPICVLYLDFRQPGLAEVINQTLLTQFQKEASQALQRAWNIYRLSNAAKIGAEINQGLGDIPTLYTPLKNNISEILDISSFFMLGVLQPHSGQIDLYMTDEGRDLVHENDELGGASKWVIENREPLIIHHLTLAQANLPAQPIYIPGTEPNVESLVFVPLVLRNDVPLGVLSIQHPQPNAFTVEDIKILEVVANHVALALSNMRLFQGLESLHQSGQFLTGQLESADILSEVTGKIREVTKADLVILYRCSGDKDQFDLPPFVSGNLLNLQFPQPTASRPDDVARLTLRGTEAVFVRDSSTLYGLLEGDASRHRGTFIQRERIASTAAVPLRVQRTRVGVLFLNYRSPQRFDRPQKYFIEVLANYAAIALNNANLFGEEATRRIRQLEQLRRIDQRITGSLDLQTVLETILDIAIEEISCDEASILLLDTDHDTLRTVAARRRNAIFSQNQVIRLSEGKGITAWVVKEGKPARVDNVQVDEPWKSLHIRVADDILSELDAPIFDDSSVIGVINLESITESAFAAHHEEFLLTLAGQVAVALQHARRFDAERQRVQELEVLQGINRTINATLDLTDVHKQIVDSVMSLTGAEIGEIRLVDRATQELVLGPSQYPPDISTDQQYTRLPWNRGVTGWCVRNKQSALIPDTKQDDRYIAYFQGMGSELAVPLIAGRALGVINLESPRLRAFTEEHQRVVEALATQAVTAIRNAEQYKRLRALSQIDETIIHSSRIEDTLPEILKLGLMITEAKWGDIRLIDLQSGEDTEIFAVVDDNKTIQKIRFGETPTWDEAPDKGIVRRVARSGEFFLSEGDVQQEPGYVGDPHIHAEVAVPLKDNDRVIGVLNIESPIIDHFDQDDLGILIQFANQAVIAIQNATHIAQASQERERFRVLYVVSQKLGSIGPYNDINEAYEIILSAAEQHSNSQVVIRRYEVDADRLVTVATRQHRRHSPQASVGRNEGVTGQVLRERRTIVVHDLANPPDGVTQPTPSDPETRTFVVIPILIGEEFYGSLTLSHHLPGHFQESDVELIEGLALELAITIQRMENTRARLEAEEGMRAAEVMLTVGHSAFELAHRLGNDLGTVKSYINEINRQLQVRGVSDAVIDESLQDIYRDVHKVLVFSQELKKTVGEVRQTGSVQRPKENIPAAELLEEAEAYVPEDRDDIQTSVQVAEGCPPIYANHQQVAEILHNLVTNAVEAMPNGGSIGLEAFPAGRNIQIRVHDTGIGIHKDRHKRIFDLFYSTKESSGFGLWNSKQYALANGGDLTVQSDPGATTFTLTLLTASSRSNPGERT